MPTYDYVCGACGAAHEIFQAITESPKRKCPACKKPKLERRIGAGAGFLFKGSGFYLTDYRSKSYAEGKKADTAAGESPSKDAGKTESTKSESTKSEPAKGEAAKPAAAPKAESKPAPAKKKGGKPD